jgi:hypothetical protein
MIKVKMTNPQIHDLNMSDTEYAALVAKGYNPEFERDLREVFGEDAEKFRKLTRFIGLIKTLSPQTDSEWHEIVSAWDDDVIRNS